MLFLTVLFPSGHIWLQVLLLLLLEVFLRILYEIWLFTLS